MSGKIFLGFLQRGNIVQTTSKVSNLYGRFGARSYSVAKKTERKAQENLLEIKKMDFNQFKKEKMESFESYRASPLVREIVGNDTAKISEAYDAYCLCRYNHYLRSFRVDNPALML